MADDSSNLTDPLDWLSIGELVGKGLLSAVAQSGAGKAVVSTATETYAAQVQSIWRLFLDAVTFCATQYEKGEQAIQPIAERAVAPIIAGLFGASVDPSSVSQRMAAGGGDGAAASIVDGFLKAATAGASGPVEPNIDGSRRLAAAAVAASLESSINALIPELVSDFLPFDLGKISALTELPEGILRSLGVGRLVRRALTPAIDGACTTPAKWYYAKLYRQTLPDAGLAAKQYARGKWDIDVVKEYLQRHGYDDATITAILDDTAKFLTVSQVFRLIRAGVWSDDDGRQHLLDAGYFTDDVDTLLTLERLADIEAFERKIADAYVTAFVDGRVDEGTLSSAIPTATISDQEKAQYVEEAIARRTANQKDLTSGETAQLVIEGVLAYADYRDALARENRTESAITALELGLRTKVDAKTTKEQHAQAIATEKAAAAQAKADAAAAKKLLADTAAHIKALGPQADLEQAAIRGLIPLSQVAELYALKYGVDAVDTLMALLTAKQAAYADAQKAKAAHVAAAAAKGANLGQIEAAVLNGVITVDDYKAQLAGLDFDPAAVDLLAATVQAKLDAKTKAAALHAAAAAKAAIKRVPIAVIEYNVRHGADSMADYTAYLQALGYDAASVAELKEKLQLEIDSDAAAAKVKAAAAARLQNKGLSLAEYHRAVVLGVKTVNEYSAFLLANGESADTAATLVQIATDDKAAADAAAAKRAATAKTQKAPAIKVTDLVKAARLGLIPISTYTARLTAAGYTADDIAIELDLLTEEIAQTKAAEAKAAAAAAKSTAKGLTLAEIAAAVKAGTTPIADYTARALALGLSTDDANTLTATLQDAVDLAAVTKARKEQLAAENASKELARADEVKAVTDGLKTIDDYSAWLTANGYSADDAALLVAELQQTQAAAAAKKAGA